MFNSLKTGTMQVLLFLDAPWFPNECNFCY